MIIHAYGAHAADQPLVPLQISRRTPGAHDVQIDIAFCGVCHSDLHQARGEWAGTHYPCVPGHEIVGRVSALGASVSGLRVGDLVGVGCIVDSCRHCADCAEDLENYCDGMVGTYNFPTTDTPGHTLGGYSQRIVVDAHYVLRIRHGEAQLAAVAPLLCAGITTWSPLRRWNIGPGKKVGIVGIGGLGHMGIKLARALGAHVVAFTTSESKREAARQLGADDVVVTRNPQEMLAHLRSFDLILNTVAAPHDLDALLVLLKRDACMTLVGAPASAHPSPDVFNLITKRRAISGSMIGGIRETQEMLDFCAEHGIVADIELITAGQINQAFERMLAGDVQYRFVIDNATLAS
ncbi:NAD(P)-dependent alcohol dehydrogenase [Pseudomonas sp. DTU_2021_1001937_2_SI_NGA_ILE_001]|uniref:NAD(P)-dependent alcohol dehydrogenase n=1 Tax=Pseudomonas sp. DTU_2021_1001937_2_SI_NGA_ILE_001 TaxID=3077589 RepID=UPI0028FC0C9E|nr:NAD(P)-dependent alcohol dehydrogenase [Pseudomonas sp. DTU_2021_1001937_2_SI_NGA_ILE_001]WNW10206.1 NAD(P)-dependent alcohol dehydrogenase [Pseudomonas sp. DTU_2021_1001937_2_SI_NGA_ILE_001]